METTGRGRVSAVARVVVCDRDHGGPVFECSALLVVGAAIVAVEAPAAGPAAVQRVQDSRIAFATFLQEGNTSQGAGFSDVAVEGITAAVFEAIYRQARASAAPQPARLLPHLAHLCLKLSPSQTPQACDSTGLYETPQVVFDGRLAAR